VASLDESQIRVLLLDIEGTTTPADFVYKTLFPYAARKFESFLIEHARSDEIQSLVSALRIKHKDDHRQGFQPPDWPDAPPEENLRSAAQFARWLIAKDSKSTALKSLQGKIWQQGYAKGELHGEVYPDVPPAFLRWRKQNRTIAIYSSGSVLAQQLLFRTTPQGDLTAHISAFFDTQVGIKQDPASYTKIASALAVAPNECLFLSDAPAEISAAQAANLHALLITRDSTSGRAPAIHTFNEIFP
jgi:enolase-phosphatase E1